MQIYTRHNRHKIRYLLRCLRWDLTKEDWATLLLVGSIWLALVMLPAQAGAQAAQPGATIPPGGTIPPVTGIHWPSDYMYLPCVLRERMRN